MAFLPENQKLLSAFVNAIGASVAVYSRAEGEDFHLSAANRQFATMLDRAPDELNGARLSHIVPRYIYIPLLEQIEACLKTQSTTEAEFVIDRGGRVTWWRFVLCPIFAGDGAARRVLNTCIDITDKKSLETSLTQTQSRFEAVVDSAYDGIISVDENHRIVLFNNAASEIFKTPKSEAVGRKLETLIPTRFREKHSSYLNGFARSPIKSRPMESRVSVMGLRSDGSEFPVEVTIAKINVGSRTEFTAVVRDISERAKLMEELQRAAIHDPLTGIHNRRHLSRILHDEIERCRRFDHVLTLAMIDLNNFKDINDTYGHQAGDEVLVAFARTIAQHLRDVDTLGRWGGDEFMVIWPETEEAQAETVMDTIRARLAEVADTLSVPDIDIAFSVGLYETDGSLEARELVLRADDRLYRDKKGAAPE